VRAYLRLLGALGRLALAPPVLGSWWQLLDILAQRDQEFAFWSERPPMSCPLDGTPLLRAPPKQGMTGVELYCPFDGWQYPRDWIRDERL
jgi:hypothetical protein